MTDTASTPALDAAIRAGCSPWHEQDCSYPACDCAPVVPDMIRTALSAALADTPAVVELMARAMFAPEGERHDKRWAALHEHGWKGREDLIPGKDGYRADARAALTALRQDLLGEG